jgi:hypothetical protein
MSFFEIVVNLMKLTFRTYFFFEEEINLVQF